MSDEKFKSWQPTQQQLRNCAEWNRERATIAAGNKEHKLAVRLTAQAYVLKTKERDLTIDHT